MNHATRLSERSKSTYSIRVARLWSLGNLFTTRHQKDGGNVVQLSIASPKGAAPNHDMAAIKNGHLVTKIMRIPAPSHGYE